MAYVEPSHLTAAPAPIDIREAYEAVFLGVLGRKPRPSEVAAWLDNQGAVTTAASLAEALRTTDEYRDNLVLQSERMARAANGRRVFFLHIPKSGGISVRSQLRACLGDVAPLLLSSTPFHWEIEPSATSWPYLTGHVGIDACPPGYSCVTVFREPRARLLSLHRFVGSRHYEDWLSSMGLDPEVSRRWRESSIETLIENERHIPTSMQRNPHVGRRGLRYAWMFASGASTADDFAALSPTERKQAIARGLERVSHAAWTHDGPGLARMIERVSGRPPGESRRLNVTSPTMSGAPDVIDARTRELIADFVRDDLEVLEMAASAGLVEAMSPDTRDAIFKKTATRLGYVFE